MDPIVMFQQMGVMAFATLLVDTVPLIGAAIYAVRPSEGKLALMRPLSLAGLFAALGGMLGGLTTGLASLARRPEVAGSSALYSGLSEALVPAVFGLLCLMVAWLLVAVGMWRGTREG
jgi:hypothetical protein